MKHRILLFTLIAFSNFYKAQNIDNRTRSLYFEIAGSGGLGSLNYESRFLEKPKMKLTWSAGFSIAPIDKNNGVGLVFPLMIHSMLGKNSHQLELGLGQGITITTRGHFYFLTTAAIGYRYQNNDKPFYYRITYTPLISYLADFQIQHWAGISIGYTFKNK